MPFDRTAYTESLGEPPGTTGTPWFDSADILLRVARESLVVAFALDAGGCWAHLCPNWETLTGWTPVETLGVPAEGLLHPDDRRAWADALDAVASGRVRVTRADLRVRRPTGGHLWVHARLMARWDADGRCVGAIGALSDATERKRAEFFSRGKRSIMEAIARGVCLADALSLVCNVYEQLVEGSRCSILLLSPDGRQLVNGVGPRLPAAYRSAIDGVAIGPDAGSCGAAAFTGRPVLVEDIATDTRWNGFCDLALEHGLRSCWSFPVKAESETVKGTLGVYHDRPALPEEWQQDLAVRLANIAAVAIGRQEVAARLRESEQRFQDIAAAASDWLWEMDAELRLTFFSERGAALFGLSAAEVLGKTCFEVTTEDPAQSKWRGLLADMRARRPFRDFEFTHACGDGEVRILRASGLPVFTAEGAFAGYRGTGTDVTRERRAAEALRLREAQLSEAQRIARMGDWLWDAGSQTLAWSDEVYRIFGVRREGFTPGFEAMLAMTHPEDRAAVADVMARLMRGGSTRDFSCRILRPDGEVRHLLVEGHCREDAAGRVAQVVGICQDITERRRAEALLREAGDAAQRANRAKSAFMAAMSHELRTPLNAIIGFSDLLAAEYADMVGEPAFREYLRDIGLGGRQLLAMINDILDVTDLESGRLELNEDALDLGRAVADATRLVESGRRIELDVPSPAPLLLGDPRRIRQVLVNLLGNATKFTPESGRIAVRVRVGGDGVEVVVADGGPGIPQDKLRDLGRPFVQLDDLGSRRYAGAGLGLHIAKALVERHGGTLTIESEPGVGTTATVRMPGERLIDMRRVLTVKG